VLPVLLVTQGFVAPMVGPDPLDSPDSLASPDHRVTSDIPASPDLLVPRDNPGFRVPMALSEPADLPAVRERPDRRDQRDRSAILGTRDQLGSKVQPDLLEGVVSVGSRATREPWGQRVLLVSQARPVLRDK